MLSRWDDDPAELSLIVIDDTLRYAIAFRSIALHPTRIRPRCHRRDSGPLLGSSPPSSPRARANEKGSHRRSEKRRGRPFLIYVTNEKFFGITRTRAYNGNRELSSPTGILYFAYREISTDIGISPRRVTHFPIIVPPSRIQRGDVIERGEPITITHAVMYAHNVAAEFAPRYAYFTSSTFFFDVIIVINIAK